MSKPARVSSANSFGDQPPRSKQIVGRASGPTRARILATTARSSPVSEAPGGVAHTKHAVAVAVADPGVDLGSHRQSDAGHMGFGDLGAAVVGAHVAVDVEDPRRGGVGVEVMTGELVDEPVGAAQSRRVLPSAGASS